MIEVTVKHLRIALDTYKAHSTCTVHEAMYEVLKAVFRSLDDGKDNPD